MPLNVDDLWTVTENYVSAAVVAAVMRTRALRTQNEADKAEAREANAKLLGLTSDLDVIFHRMTGTPLPTVLSKGPEPSNETSNPNATP